jgi:hypothetical protein
MRISIFTGKLNDPQCILAVKEAAGCAVKEFGSDFLVLPGYSFGQRHTNVNDVQQIADEIGLIIFAEVISEAQKIGNVSFCFIPRRDPKGPFKQLFTQGVNASLNAVRTVADSFSDGSRIINIHNKRIGILLCGENNILTNIQKRSNAPEPRHGIAWPFSAYDVLINSSHTIMRQWNLLHKRFSYFSRANRTLLYCTNNDKTGASWKSALCIYRNEDLLSMGDFKNVTDVRTKKTENWRMATVEV